MKRVLFLLLSIVSLVAGSVFLPVKASFSYENHPYLAKMEKIKRREEEQKQKRSAFYNQYPRGTAFLKGFNTADALSVSPDAWLLKPYKKGHVFVEKATKQGDARHVKTPCLFFDFAFNQCSHFSYHMNFSGTVSPCQMYILDEAGGSREPTNVPVRSVAKRIEVRLPFQGDETRSMEYHSKFLVYNENGEFVERWCYVPASPVTQTGHFFNAAATAEARADQLKEHLSGTRDCTEDLKKFMDPDGLSPYMVGRVKSKLSESQSVLDPMYPGDGVVDYSQNFLKQPLNAEHIRIDTEPAILTLNKLPHIAGVSLAGLLGFGILHALVKIVQDQLYAHSKNSNNKQKEALKAVLKKRSVKAGQSHVVAKETT